MRRGSVGVGRVGGSGGGVGWRKEGAELGDGGSVASVGGAEGEVEFAGFLQFAAEGEEGVGCWGFRGEGEREALYRNQQY